MIQTVLDITMYKEQELQMATTLLEHTIASYKDKNNPQQRRGGNAGTGSVPIKYDLFVHFCGWKMQKRLSTFCFVFVKVVGAALHCHLVFVPDMTRTFS